MRKKFKSDWHTHKNHLRKCFFIVGSFGQIQMLSLQNDSKVIFVVMVRPNQQKKEITSIRLIERVEEKQRTNQHYQKKSVLPSASMYNVYS